MIVIGVFFGGGGGVGKINLLGNRLANQILCGASMEVCLASVHNFPSHLKK